MLSSVQFADSGQTVSEIGAAVALRVTNTGNVSQPVTVKYTTGGGTATPGSDYVATTGTL